MYSPGRSHPEPKITLRSFNITPSRRKVQETFFGKIRAFSTFTKLEWIYLGVSFVGLTAALGLTIERLAYFKTNTSDFTFGIFLVLTTAFCFYYVIHAVLTERANELMVYVVSNLLVLIYCIANYVLSARNDIKLTRLILVCILSTILIPVGLYLSLKYFRSNNLIFNTVGGVTHLQSACKIYYLCSSLLKFDLQLQLTLFIFTMGSTSRYKDLTEEFVLGFSVVLTVIFVVLGFVGLCRESRVVMISFFILGLCEPACVAYKFYYVAVHGVDGATYRCTFASGCFALLVWVALMLLTGYYTKYCFYQGLKEKMFSYLHENVVVPPQSASSLAEDNASPSSFPTVKPFEAIFHSSLPPTSTLSPDPLNVTVAENPLNSV